MQCVATLILGSIALATLVPPIVKGRRGFLTVEQAKLQLLVPDHWVIRTAFCLFLYQQKQASIGAPMAGTNELRSWGGRWTAIT
ncbi:hypothetical protein BX666DRAFT_178574 [Dichotomocladium elegans]|nr:hypothetical protein BX666DRAFT_178574 [Dichotomocladium elegans]